MTRFGQFRQIWAEFEPKLGSRRNCSTTVREIGQLRSSTVPQLDGGLSISAAIGLYEAAGITKLGGRPRGQDEEEEPQTIPAAPRRVIQGVGAALLRNTRAHQLNGPQLTQLRDSMFEADEQEPSLPAGLHACSNPTDTTSHRNLEFVDASATLEKGQTKSPADIYLVWRIQSHPANANERVGDNSLVRSGVDRRSI